MSPFQPPLPEIPWIEAQLRNALFTHTPWKRKSLADGRQTFIRFGVEPPLIHTDFQFYLKAGEQPLLLAVQLAPASPWWQKFHDEIDLDALPDPFRVALVGAFLSEVIDTIQTSFETEIRHSQLENFPIEKASISFGWTVLGEKAETLSSGTLRITPLLAAALVRSVRKWERPVPVSTPLISLDASLCLERSQIPLFMVKNLESGDAFFLRTPPDKLQDVEVLIPGAPSLLGRFPPCQLETILTPCPLMSDHSAQSPASPRDESSPSWVDEINVEVSFRVGVLRMPLTQLAGLTEGHVIEINQPPQPTIEILVNQQVIGSGSLVRVGEKLAVCVQEVRHFSNGS